MTRVMADKLRFVVAGAMLYVVACGCGGGGGGTVGNVGNASVTEIIPGPPPPVPNTMEMKYARDQEGGKGTPISNATYDMGSTALGGSHSRGAMTSATYRMEGRVTVGP